MNLWKIFPILGIAVLLLSGCTKGKPDGIPELYPVSITLTKDGAPVADANIGFTAKTAASGSWSVSGKTDATGVAVISTAQGSWKGDGAPEGEFIVHLTKQAAIEEPELPANMEEDSPEKQAYFAERLKRLEAAAKEIPESLKQPKTSTLTVTVEKGTGATVTFDLTPYK